MNHSEIIFMIACAWLVLVPAIFIYHKVYDDGVLGRASLSMICGLAAMMLMVQFFSDLHRYAWMPMEVSLLALAFAVFLTWHLIRFHRRVVKRARAASGRMLPG